MLSLSRTNMLSLSRTTRQTRGANYQLNRLLSSTSQDQMRAAPQDLSVQKARLPLYGMSDILYTIHKGSSTDTTTATTPESSATPLTTLKSHSLKLTKQLSNTYTQALHTILGPPSFSLMATNFQTSAQFNKDGWLASYQYCRSLKSKVSTFYEAYIAAYMAGDFAAMRKLARPGVTKDLIPERQKMLEDGIKPVWLIKNAKWRLVELTALPVDDTHVFLRVVMALRSQQATYLLDKNDQVVMGTSMEFGKKEEYVTFVAPIFSDANVKDEDLKWQVLGVEEKGWAWSALRMREKKAKEARGEQQ